MMKVIIAAIIITIVGLFFMTKIDPTVNNTSALSLTESEEGEDSSLVKVGITGEIVHPGSYSISPQSTLSDLIKMAGGTTEDADPGSYTPGLVIGSRTAFYISKLTDVPQTCSVTYIVKVNINTAAASSLENIGFTSVQADALVTYRETNGNFQALEDIMKVSGIGEKTFIKVRDSICLA
jgi:competence protein ComEA